MGKLKITRGTSYTITYQHQHDGAAYPLTGATLYFTVKSAQFDTDAADAAALIAKTVTSFTNAAGGIHTLTLSPTDTYLTPGTFYYDIRVAESGGNEYMTDSGTVTITGSPTNRNV
jgi:hypothetical protein